MEAGEDVFDDGTGRAGKGVGAGYSSVAGRGLSGTGNSADGMGESTIFSCAWYHLTENFRTARVCGEGNGFTGSFMAWDFWEGGWQGGLDF